MPYAIIADFPLGVYHGHTGRGQDDHLPSLARLHSAFVAAAGSGTKAIRGLDGVLRPCPAHSAALKWLETHPPDGLAVPIRRHTSSDAKAYRDLGLLKPKLAGTKRIGKLDQTTLALSGSV
ncbi:MAG: type I-U CRISPR-associated protein Cas5/Cas6, partial [Bifidobacteriaceae bacterium]|nr:type I-U CRISPR-associated protein Cas5/Cas6 [Bifidobacteriaceae bacterium]